MLKALNTYIDDTLFLFFKLVFFSSYIIIGVPIIYTYNDIYG